MNEIFMNEFFMLSLELMSLATPLIFLGIGVFLFIAGIRSVLERKSFLKTAIKAEGTIISIKQIELVSDEYGGGGTAYQPEVEYTLETGEIRTFFSGRVLSNSFIVGSKVKILYSKDSPNIGEIDSVFSVWSSSRLNLCIGGIFILVPLRILWSFW